MRDWNRSTNPVAETSSQVTALANASIGSVVSIRLLRPGEPAVTEYEDDPIRGKAGEEAQTDVSDGNPANGLVWAIVLAGGTSVRFGDRPNSLRASAASGSST
jgi:hypothetical protein